MNIRSKGIILCFSAALLLTLLGGAASGATNSSGHTRYNGMYASGSGAKDTNYGTISTTSSSTRHIGMWAVNGASAWNETSGVINTALHEAYGMLAESNGKAYNKGSIETHGESAIGMYAYFQGGEAHNDEGGKILTTGYKAYGMSAHSSGSTADNKGDIETRGEDAYGMYAYNGSEVKNLAGGHIVTDNKEAHGMVASGNGSEASNKGSIVTHGPGSYGMFANLGAEVRNYSADTIETFGDGAHGIMADNAEGENSGSIITHGVSSYGM